MKQKVVFTANLTWRVFSESLRGFFRHNGMGMSASIAYYSAFSLAPLLLIAMAIAGAFFGDEAVRVALEGELGRQMGPSAAFVMRDMVSNARKSGEGVLMSIAGIGLLLVGAAGVFVQLQRALNTIWNVVQPPAKGISYFVRMRLLSFSMVLVTGFMLLASMVLTTLLHAVGDYLDARTGIPLVAWVAGSGMLSFLVITLLLAAIFRILPSTNIQWSNVWGGAAFTTLLFMLGKSAIGWYLGHQATASSYGSAGSFAVMLIWLYYSSIVVLFGAECTAAHARVRHGSMNPNE